MVTALTSMCSLLGSDNEKGETLGVFRSSGQLGRALGPIITCSLYWVYGPEVYQWGAAGVSALFLMVTVLLKETVLKNKGGIM